MRLLVVLVLGVIACADDQAPADPDPACFDGDERLCAGSNVGACQRGVQLCIAGAWQACTDAVGPTTEVCNEVDDDCDGAIDNADCVLVCPAGYADCNGEREDGCETDLGVSATCGACDRACSDGLVCELGACRALPQILWTDHTGLNAVCGLSLADNGDTYVSGFLRDPLTLGGRSTEPYGEYHFDIYASVITPDGWARWLIRDGDGPGGEGPIGSAHVPSTGGMVVTGSVYNPTTIANQSFPQFTEERGYVASYGPDGAGRWAAVAPSGGSYSRPFVGPAGIDIVHRAGATQRFSRFDGDGTIIASATVESTTTSWFYPIGQADEAAILLANVAGEISSDCTVSAGDDRLSAIVTIAPDGGCEAKVIMRTSGSVGFWPVPRLAGGVLIGGTISDGTLTAGAVTLSSSTATPFVLAFDATGALVFHRAEAGGTTLDFTSDDRGNVYWLRSYEYWRCTVDSFRPDGVPRWSLPIINTSPTFPGTNLVANGRGQLAISIPGSNEIHIGSTTLYGVGYRVVVALLQAY